MILVLDTGNTNVHIGLFTRGVLRATWRLATDPRRTVDEYALQFEALLGGETTIEGAIVSSVVPRVLPLIAEAVEKTTHVRPMILSAETEIGVQNGYLNPDEVGMDRLANAVGGVHLHGAPLLILDYGTAITLDYVSAAEAPGMKPVYEGGAIMPGMEMAAEALARGTAKLPGIDISDAGPIIGKTTVQSIRSGLIHGYLGAVRTLVESAQAEIGHACKVVGTGGDSARYKEKMPFLHAIEPDLTLYGLRQIYGINNNCPLK